MMNCFHVILKHGLITIGRTFKVRTLREAMDLMEKEFPYEFEFADEIKVVKVK
jgi:hypothetical protein